MTNRVLLVTEPDDSLLDGIRLLLVDLRPEQTQIISDSLTQLETIPNVIAYVWYNGNNIDWLMDKKHKSNLIIFNAESENEIITGYMAAQKNSCYFGVLRSLTSVNDSVIYNSEQLLKILEDLIKQHDEN